MHVREVEDQEFEHEAITRAVEQVEVRRHRHKALGRSAEQRSALD